jgi:hypothetical protein
MECINNSVFIGIVIDLKTADLINLLFKLKFKIMKKRILRTFSVIAVMAAMIAMISCGNRRADVGDKTVLMPVDTTGFAQFKAWKQQQNQNAAVATSYKPVKSTTVHSSTSGRTAKTETGTMSTTNQYPAKTKPKGWSKAAKGTVIGAGSGAVLGAIINKKNRAVGAVIGGVAGGAVGYGVGRHIDKKDGRY